MMYGFDLFLMCALCFIVGISTGCVILARSARRSVENALLRAAQHCDTLADLCRDNDASTIARRCADIYRQGAQQ